MLSTPLHHRKPPTVSWPCVAQIYRHILAGPLWQRRNGTDFAFFQSHTGFARGENGGVYEDMLCIDFAPALHFVNVRAQRYKCPARPGLCSLPWRLQASVPARAAHTDGQVPEILCSTWCQHFAGCY